MKTLEFEKFLHSCCTSICEQFAVWRGLKGRFVRYSGRETPEIPECNGFCALHNIMHKMDRNARRAWLGVSYGRNARQTPWNQRRSLLCARCEWAGLLKFVSTGSGINGEQKNILRKNNAIRHFRLPDFTYIEFFYKGRGKTKRKKYLPHPRTADDVRFPGLDVWICFYSFITSNNKRDTIIYYLRLTRTHLQPQSHKGSATYKPHAFNNAAIINGGGARNPTPPDYIDWRRCGSGAKDEWTQRRWRWMYEQITVLTCMHTYTGVRMCKSQMP